MTDKDRIKSLIINAEIIDSEVCRKVKEIIYKEDYVKKEMADFIFELNYIVEGKDFSKLWRDQFVLAITNHVLKNPTSFDILSDTEADYLINKAKSIGEVNDYQLALHVKILKRSKSYPEKFRQFVFNELKNRIIKDDIITSDATRIIAKIIYRGGASGYKIDRVEADYLFELHKIIKNQKDKEWIKVMIRAILKHLFANHKTIFVIKQEEADWLIGKLSGRKDMDEIELLLLKKIKEEATSMPENLSVFIGV